MQRSITFALASALALGALAFSTAAQASETPTTEIRYADLNLDRQAGAAAMLGRIRIAAEGACGHRTGLMPLSQRIALRACMRAESEQAVRDVGNSTLTALFYNRHPRVIVAAN